MKAIRDQFVRLAIVVTVLLATLSSAASAAPPEYPPVADVRATFLKQLDRPRVSLDPHEESIVTSDGLVAEQLTFASERKTSGEIERVPLLLLRPAVSDRPLPAVIVLHGTGGSKEGLRPFLGELVQRGMIGVAIDARYHGDRSGGAEGSAAYVAAITKAWRTPVGEPQEHPFYLDTVWDLWRTIDYLETRGDIDGARLGMIGFSMGGIQTWLAASVDERIRVAVPAISVQSFRWSLEHEQWQGRARTIRDAHLAAAADLGEPEINARVCRELWNKLIPGILDQFDCPSMLRLFAPRPLLIVNGELDPNCPLEGAKIAFAAAEQAYRETDAADKLKIMVAPGVAHKVTDEQRAAALDWLQSALAQPAAKSSF